MSSAAPVESRPLLTGFPPISRADARVLILGSMPGEKSLQENQYYAHPHNRFWPLMGELFGAGTELAYPERAAKLIERRIAVWDVLKHCRRDGSLDTAICPASQVVNDFAGFFALHPQLRAVFFNGRKAEMLFRKGVAPVLKQRLEGLALLALPSTSPANASVSAAAKREAWQQIHGWL
jgi:hypoxanthine-DNA glycosylase